MEKTVKISGKEYNLKSSAFTPFAYKNFTGNDLLKDLNKLSKLNAEIEKIADEDDRNSRWMEELFPILEMSLKIAYVMIKEKDKNFISYESWVSNMEYLMDDASWISEVMETAISPISGQLQKNQNIQ